MRQLGSAAMAATLLLACSSDNTDTPIYITPAPPVALTRVSGPTPYAAGCDHADSGGTLYSNAEVEPSAAVNPFNTQNMIGTWQQDRWSNGGSHALVAAFSTDGGATWTTPRDTPFSRCSGGTSLNGGAFLRASDPWITFTPTGDAYWLALTFSNGEFTTGSSSAMRVSKSTDGGDTWSLPVTLRADDDTAFNDKGAITADTTLPTNVYAVWDQIERGGSGQTWFARTTTSGASWETARVIYDPGTRAQTLGNIIVVLSTGTLVNLLTQINYDFTGNAINAELDVIRSTDQGATWSSPVKVGALLGLGAVDPQTGTPIRDGAILGSIAVGASDELLVTWQDSRFSSGDRDGIALSTSADGGLTWTTPVQVNGAPAFQAFTPTVRVAGDGTIGVTYFDLRDDTRDRRTLLADLWLATSTDGVNWSERLVSGPFNLNIAPYAEGLFLGDYHSLQTEGTDFLPFFVQANDRTGNRTDVYTVRLPTVVPGIGAAVKPRAYSAARAPKVVMTREWESKLRENYARQVEHQFPDRERKPDQKPGPQLKRKASARRK